MRSGCSPSVPFTVHPHMRGEHFISQVHAITRIGSSPHAWGTFSRRATKLGRRSVHPHMRGEHEWKRKVGTGRVGSSPHAWGTCIHDTLLKRCPRFIPTCVGNMWGICVQNHADRGSSPHAWGTFHQENVRWLCARFIPTCVGNIIVCILLGLFLPVHPHMRGEHYPLRMPSDVMCGSSPHAWGTCCEIWLEGTFSRFIPTCVGNIRCGAPRFGLMWVHPHMRGEHAITKFEFHNFLRFIPTCVGNMLICPRLPCIPTVHPHMRGEHIPKNRLDAGHLGSSPHAWGTSVLVALDPDIQRFIPTCVGNIEATIPR